MISIKSSSFQSLEPDPNSQSIDDARVLFVNDEPQQEDEIINAYQLAKKTQGSEAGTSQEGLTTPKSMPQESDNSDSSLDTSSKALTDEHKKGLKDETTVKIQSLADDSVKEKVSAQESVSFPTKTEKISDTVSDTVIEEHKTDDTNITPQENSQQELDVIEKSNQFFDKKIIQPKKQPPLNAIISSKIVSKKSAPKIESKKHRPIDVGNENHSKIELTKDVTEKNIQKKTTISLQDLNLQQGFTDFVKKGNAHFSSEGNSLKDDEQGLKRASYTNQVGKMHENSFLSYPNKYRGTVDNIPVRDSIINIIIDRSGKVTLMRLQSSGDLNYDDYHMKVLQFMGNCPPVPKFIESNFQIPSILYPGRSRSFGAYQPEKLQI